MNGRVKMSDVHGRVRQPAGDWYGPTEEHSFWNEGSNPLLAEFGARLGLPCGGAWICSGVEHDYAVEILFAADGYNHMARINWFDQRCDKWPELREHLAKYHGTLFTTQAPDQIRTSLGLPLC